MVRTYYPASIEEALILRDREDTTIYAGGTDLMVKRKNMSGLLPLFDKPVIFIGHLEQLKKITQNEESLLIGAACTYSQLLAHRDIPELLKKAIREIASPAIRNRGTIGGNIGNASPAGDTLPVLYVLNAQLHLISNHGLRTQSIHDFILGPGRIALKSNEFIAMIELPIMTWTKTTYRKVGARKADAISKVSFVGQIQREGELVTDLRLAFGAVGKTVVRPRTEEALCIGKTLTAIKEDYSQIEKAFGEKIRPIDDQRSTASYRKNVALRLLKDFIFSEDDGTM